MTHQVRRPAILKANPWNRPPSALPFPGDPVLVSRCPFDLAWYYAGRYWPVLLLIAAVIVITAILIRRWRKK